jgi:hypothetical protein
LTIPRPLLWAVAALALPVVIVLAVPLAALALVVFVPLVVSQRVYGWLLGGDDLADDGSADGELPAGGPP